MSSGIGATVINRAAHSHAIPIAKVVLVLTLAHDMAIGRVLIGTGQQGRQLFISKIDHRPETVLTDETWTTERQPSYHLSVNVAKQYINIQENIKIC
ncbi:Transcription factor tausubunit [Trichinella pseudospiralis]